MRFPQVVVCASDVGPENLLRPLVDERRWLLRPVRQLSAARALVVELRPTVLLVQANPSADPSDALRFVAEVHRSRPDVAIVVFGDVKRNEDARAAWTAAVYDLGARYVLSPPLTRSVLQDVVGGLMDAVCRATRAGRAVPSEEVIDLADTEYEEA